jgi:hypothetical protein
VRRLYVALRIKQREANDWVDLTSFFFLPHPAGRESPMLPSIGLSTEVLVPWTMKKDQTLILQAVIDQHETFIPDHHQFARVMLSGFIKD